MNKDKNRYYKFYKTIGSNIKTLRKAKNISQEELAFLVSSARNYIGCIERAEKIPSLSFILDIKNALECKLKDLLEDI